MKSTLAIIEDHENFYVPCFNQTFTLKAIESNVCEPSSSLMLIKYFRNHEFMIQEEVNNEDLDEEEVVHFDEESDDESEKELEMDPIA